MEGWINGRAKYKNERQGEGWKDKKMMDTQTDTQEEDSREDVLR